MKSAMILITSVFGNSPYVVCMITFMGHSYQNTTLIAVRGISLHFNSTSLNEITTLPLVCFSVQIALELFGSVLWQMTLVKNIWNTWNRSCWFSDIFPGLEGFVCCGEHGSDHPADWWPVTDFKLNTKLVLWCWIWRRLTPVNMCSVAAGVLVFH